PLQIESDSHVLCIMVEHGNELYLPIISDCRSLMLELGRVKLRYVYREANVVIDALTKHGMNLTSSYGRQPWHPSHYYLSPPPFVLLAFNKECSEDLNALTILACNN
ncbi:hypothetical protein A4A49_64461, partial [Nicotiana attenuata]